MPDHAPALPRRFSPPVLTGEQARLARALAQRRAPFAVAGLAVSFQAAPAGVEDPVRLALTLAGAPARASLPRALLRRVLAALDPAAAEAEGEAACLLLELALEPALAALESAMPGLSVRLEPGSPGAWPDRLAAGLRCRDAAGSHDVRLDLSPAAARRLAAGLARLPAEPRAVPGLAVALRVRAMATDLPLGAVRALRQGDVILAALPGRDASRVLLVAGERVCWRAGRDGRMITVATRRLAARRAGFGEWMMDDTASHIEAGRPALADETASLDELPVRLVFELGRLELPLAELERIGPGHVFELAACDQEQAVDILAQGRRIGRGRIVAVGDGLGVQVAWIGRDG